MAIDETGGPITGNLLGGPTTRTTVTRRSRKEGQILPTDTFDRLFFFASKNFTSLLDIAITIARFLKTRSETPKLGKKLYERNFRLEDMLLLQKLPLNVKTLQK